LFAIIKNFLVFLSDFLSSSSIIIIIIIIIINIIIIITIIIIFHSFGVFLVDCFTFPQSMIFFGGQ